MNELEKQVKIWVKDNYISMIYENGEVHLCEEYEDYNYRTVVRLMQADRRGLLNFIQYLKNINLIK